MRLPAFLPATPLQVVASLTLDKSLFRICLLQLGKHRLLFESSMITFYFSVPAPDLQVLSLRGGGHLCL